MESGKIKNEALLEAIEVFKAENNQQNLKNFIEKFTIPNISSEQIQMLRNAHSQTEIDECLTEIYQINLPSPNLWE